MNKVYIYLANRNKNGIQILSVLNSKEKYNPTKVQDASKLGLQDQELENKISQYFYKNRMYWDLYVETAVNFKELKSSLKKRGYQNLPSFGGTMFTEQTDAVINKLSNKQNIIIKSSVNNIKTMIRKNNN